LIEHLIRIEEERRTLIDRAAEAAGKDRTQFVPKSTLGAMSADGIRAPEHLTAAHDVSAFACGTLNLKIGWNAERVRMRRWARTSVHPAQADDLRVRMDLRRLLLDPYGIR
jgi:hypothetical protein